MNRYLFIVLTCTLSMSCIGCSSESIHDETSEFIEEEADSITPTFWTLWDSFGASNSWQPRFAELTGWQFLAEENNDKRHPVSKGGTNTSAGDSQGSLERAQNLAALKGKHPIDVILFENVNDIHFCTDKRKPSGSLDDRPWMQQGRLTAHRCLDSRKQAETFIADSIEYVLKGIATEKRIDRNILEFPYLDSSNEGTRIEITSTAKQDGVFYIMVGNQKFGITVDTTMTRQDIVDKIVEWHYGSGWVDYDNGDGSVTLSFWTNTDMTIGFEANETGVEALITQDVQTKVLRLFFTGSGTDQWEDSRCWTSSISLYSTYKGLFGFLREEFPAARICLVIPTYHKADLEDLALRNTDGSWNEEAYLATHVQLQWKQLKAFWHEICPTLGIEIIDLEDASGIRLENLSQFYNANDVHPNLSGYDLWAETLSKLLVNK